MTLVGADGKVNVKKELLRVLSPVFAALLTENNVTRIDASDVKRQLLLAFVTFIETDRIENDSKEVFDLIMLGHGYQMSLLKKMAEKVIVNHHI